MMIMSLPNVCVPVTTGTMPLMVQYEESAVMGYPGASADQLMVEFGPEVPDTFLEGLRDIQNGRLTDLEIAHNEPPPVH
jgi:hypothetical protein